MNDSTLGNDFITVWPHPLRKTIPDDLFNSIDILINVSDFFDMNLNEQLVKKGIQTFWFPWGNLSVCR